MLKNTFNIFILIMASFASGLPADQAKPFSSELNPNYDEIHLKNQQKFAELKKFQLPLGQYAIISSGPLGIRNIREIGDIDIIVTQELWDVLAAKYGVSEKDGVKKIVFPGDLIEAFREGSFPHEYKDAPTIAERIAKAEIIEGMPFESLDSVLFYKRKMQRQKDIKDVALIENWLKSQKSQ